MGQAGFFDVKERLLGVSNLGDQLAAFADAVDFEQFKAVLEQTLAYTDDKRAAWQSAP